MTYGKAHAPITVAGAVVSPRAEASGSSSGAVSGGGAGMAIADGNDAAVGGGGSGRVVTGVLVSSSIASADSNNNHNHNHNHNNNNNNDHSDPMDMMMVVEDHREVSEINKRLKPPSSLFHTHHINPPLGYTLSTKAPPYSTHKIPNQPINQYLNPPAFSVG